MTLNPISSLEEESLQPLTHYGPVTSLKIFKTFIFAGYGSTFKVFQVVDNKTTLIFSKQMFKRNKIHHICVSPSGNKIGISGGRSFMLLDTEKVTGGETSEKATDGNTLSEPIEKATNEWITSSEFLDDSTLLLLNSHNTVYQIDLSTYSMEKIHCDEKSIIYSGSIRVLPSGKVVIAAGTVMNGVIIWDLESKKIIYNLTEHEGSIFGVKIDESAKYIISCSDDRSIKLYSFETGKLLATGWGHGSRIWNLEFFKTDNEVKIMSTGEDCTVRIWKYESDNTNLTQLELWENTHLGKHVWSGDVDDTLLKACVSGGADGRIRLHDLQNRGITDEYSLNMISQQTSLTFEKKEIIKQCFELPGLDLLVLLTSHGKIIKFDQLRKEFSSIHLENDESMKFREFGIMKGFQDLNVVMVVTRSGDMLVMKFGESCVQPEKIWIHDALLGSNKVTNVLTEVDYQNNLYYVLIDCPNPKIPFIVRVFSSTFSLINTLQLDQPEQTSFTTTGMVIDPTNNWLILSSRYVTLAVYDLSESSLSGIFKKLAQGDTITSISIIETSANLLTLLVTVRDGVYMYLDLVKGSEGFSVQIKQHNKLSRGFVEGGFIHGDDLILYGFRSSSFYIWNETKQLEVMTELCGGSHRLWKLFRADSHENSRYKFVYTNKSTLYINNFTGRFINDRYGLINNGTHGREIRDVTISPEKWNNEHLVMTASEDATVRLGKLSQDGQISTIWSLNNHISGLQRVKFLDSEFVGSSAANEEFIIWKIDNSGGPRNSATCPLISEFTRLKPTNDNPDLRIMDFDSFKFKDGFIVTTVYSDSNIRLWYFDTVCKKFQLLASNFYSTFCILDVNLLKFGERTFVQISTTDGFLSVWEITDILVDVEREAVGLGKMIIKQQLHQNAVKAVLTLSTDTGYQIFTGGDDNSLILSTLSLENGELKLMVESFVEKAASSTITSISKSAGETVVVTSVDQIVRKWSYSESKLVCLAARYTTIADTGCSDSVIVDGKTLAIIGGAGLSVWEV